MIQSLYFGEADDRNLPPIFTGRAFHPLPGPFLVNAMRRDQIYQETDLELVPTAPAAASISFVLIEGEQQCTA